MAFQLRADETFVADYRRMREGSCQFIRALDCRGHRGRGCGVALLCRREARAGQPLRSIFGPGRLVSRRSASNRRMAENWYRLGRYRQLDFEHADIPLAISYYRRAVQLNPRSAYYKLDLASALEMSGNTAEADKYFRAAQENYPISARGVLEIWQFPAPPAALAGSVCGNSPCGRWWIRS